MTAASTQAAPTAVVPPASSQSTRGEEPTHAAGFARRYLEEWLLLAATSANLLVLATSRYFPYQDPPNHLARYVLIERALFGVGTPGIGFRALPTPYIAVDLLGALLVHLVGPDAALRVVVALAIVFPSLGLYALLRAVAPGQRGWALVGALYAFSWCFLLGYLSYCIAVGLALLWLAWWWPHRDTRSWPRRAALAVGMAGLYLTHLAAPPLALVTVGSHYLTCVAGRRLTGRARGPFLGPELWTLVTVLTPVVVLWLWGALVVEGGGVVNMVAQYEGAWHKAQRLAGPFYSFSAAQMAVIAGGYLFALGVCLAASRRARHLDTFALATLAFLALYVVSPRWGDVDQRWLAGAYLLPFCAFAAVRRRPAPALLGVLLAVTLAHAVVIHRYSRTLDRELAAYDRVLTRIPSGARTLPLVADGQRHGRVSPYFHFALRHTIYRGGWVPGLFNLTGEYEGQAPDGHLAHFVAPEHRYFPPSGWGTRQFEPLDWTRIKREYDFVVQAGPDRRVRKMVLQAGLRELWREGDVTLFSTSGSP